MTISLIKIKNSVENQLSAEFLLLLWSFTNKLYQMHCLQKLNLCSFPFLNPQNQLSADISTVIISAEIIVCRNNIIWKHHCLSIMISSEILQFQLILKSLLAFSIIFHKYCRIFCRKICNDGFNNLSSWPQKLSAGWFTFWEPGSPVPPLFAPLSSGTDC